MQQPDIIGLTLKESILLLEANGFAYRTKIYTAPRDVAENIDNELFRVVRAARISDSELELTVCKI